jgi:hypothetical protein
MVANDLRLDIDRINAEVRAEMNAKPEAVEKGAGREHPIMATDYSRDVGKRIGRISDRDKHCLRSSAHDFWNYIAIDRSVLFQKSQPTLGIAAVSGAAGLFVDAGRDQHHASTVQCVVIAIGNVDPRTERNPITQIGRYRFRDLSFRLTRTISRALPRVTAASAMAFPTFPVPMMPSFIAALRC